MSRIYEGIVEVQETGGRMTTWAQLRAERDAANAVAEQPAATGEQG